MPKLYDPEEYKLIKKMYFEPDPEPLTQEEVNERLERKKSNKNQAR